MTQTLGIFNAIFGIDDQASAKLKAIRANTHDLNQVALGASIRVSNIGNALLTTADELQGFPDATRNLRAVSDRLEDISEQGRISSSALRTLSLRLLMAANSADPKLKQSIRGASASLADLSAELRVSEQNVGKTVNRFQFMGDVSDNVALGMRTVSAAAQGMMLAMSALDKNVIGLTFSLIFLQFSGALKLSLGFAAVALAGGIVFKQFQKIFKLKKEAEEFNAAAAIATGGPQAGDIITQRAIDVAGQLQLSTDDTKDATEAFKQALLELRVREIDPTTDALIVFSSAYLTARATGDSLEEGIKLGIGALGKFSDETLRAGNIVGSEFAKMEKEAGLALGLLQAKEKGLIDETLALAQKISGLSDSTIENFKAMAGAAGSFIVDVIADGLQLTDREAIDLNETIKTAPKIFRDAMSSVEGEIGGLSESFLAVNSELVGLRDSAVGYFEVLGKKAGVAGDVITEDLIAKIAQARADLVLYDDFQKELFGKFVPLVPVVPAVNRLEQKLATREPGAVQTLSEILADEQNKREIEAAENVVRDNYRKSLLGDDSISSDPTTMGINVPTPIIGGGLKGTSLSGQPLTVTIDIHDNNIGSEGVDQFSRVITSDIMHAIRQTTSFGKTVV
jgi:hypothetical protein